MKIKLYSDYNQFNHTKKSSTIEWTTEDAPIECYSDNGVFEYTPNGKPKFAMLIECRSINQAPCEYIEKNFYNFEHIFTHDSKLLKTLPNALPINFANIWYSDVGIKDKGISMVVSDKQFSDMHIKRQKLGEALQKTGRVDMFGKYFTGQYDANESIHKHYKFEVVVENYLDKDGYWFTEKLCNCLACKTVPIYLGSEKISDYFDMRGILQAKDFKDVIDIVNSLDVDKKYKELKDAIDINYTAVWQFEVFEDWFYNTYKDILRRYTYG